MLTFAVNRWWNMCAPQARLLLAKQLHSDRKWCRGSEAQYTFKSWKCCHYSGLCLSLRCKTTLVRCKLSQQGNTFIRKNYNTGFIEASDTAVQQQCETRGAKTAALTGRPLLYWCMDSSITPGTGFQSSTLREDMQRFSLIWRPHLER